MKLRSNLKQSLFSAVKGVVVGYYKDPKKAIEFGKDAVDAKLVGSDRVKYLLERYGTKKNLLIGGTALAAGTGGLMLYRKNREKKSN